MGLSVLKILAILNVLVFLALILFTRGERNRFYIMYILLSYPFTNISIVPIVDSFDIITIFFFLTLYRKRDVHLSNGKIYILFFLGLVATLITGIILAGSYSEETVEQSIGMFTAFAFAKILIDELVADPYFFYDVIKVFKVALILSFVFLGLQVLFGVEKISLFRTMNPNILLQDSVRYPSFLADPQAYSAWSAAISFLCLVKDPRDEKFNKLNYLLVIGALVGILMSGGRAGLLGWGIGMALVVFFGNATYRFAIIIAIIGLYVIAVNFGDSFAMFKRSGDLGDTYDFRYSIWQDAYTMFQKHPFFGIGFGNYADYVARFHPDQVWIVENEPVYFDHPESGYLKFLTEFGIIGSMCIAGLIVLPMIRAFIYYLLSKDAAIILLIAGLLAWMTGFYSTYTMGDTRIKLLVVTVVCLLITSRQRLAALVDEQLSAATATETDENTVLHGAKA